ncbi:MAG TPA: magnesium and cobalt transport protein CorA [Caldimonas sp.]|jgi:magnesium transporter|nr:magnesium and cobalt transport protein CorA [Caldimonas sp.]HEX2542251.1 magnesium and cobalt transport protein CorA [Caldimonas sp.]
MLINCVAYENGKKLADCVVDDISEFLARPDCFVWVALKDASPDELATMQHEFGLHDLAVEDARHGHQRPKIEEYGETLFAVLHTVQLNAEEVAVGELNIFVGPNFVLSVRNGMQEGFLGVRARAEREPHLLRHGSAFVFYALMDAVVDRYFPIIDALEADLEVVEAGIFEPGLGRANIERLYALKQKVSIVKHAVSPLLEGVARLVSGRVPQVCATNREYFRDVFDHLTRCNASLDALRETIGTAIQVNLSMVTIEESEITKRLAAWAGIFAVATAFAGIWGMNFEAMPELKFRWGYPAALAIIAAACGFVWWRFKRARWI